MPHSSGGDSRGILWEITYGSSSKEVLAANLSLVPRTHLMDGENLLPQAVL